MNRESLERHVDYSAVMICKHVIGWRLRIQEARRVLKDNSLWITFYKSPARMAI